MPLARRAAVAAARLALLVVALGGVLSVTTARAQDPSLRIQVVSIADQEYPNAAAVVDVADDGASDPPVLSASNFTATLDGKPVAVTGVSLASSGDVPLDLVLMIDTSGSMEGAPLAAAKAAATSFISGLDPRDRVALYNFGDNVETPLDFTLDRAAALRAVDALVARGNTALYQATTVAAVKIASSTSPRRAVVLLSDGADFGGRSTATRAEALTAAGSVGVKFFVIAQGTDLDRPFLQELAGVTSGSYLEAPNPEDLQALYDGIGRQLRSQYIVSFDVSSAGTAAEARVGLTMTAGERTASAEGLYRPGLSFAPTLNITGVTPGEELTAPREVTLTASNGAQDLSIVWYVDNVVVEESKGAPYVFLFDPANYAGGAHELRAVVDTGGRPIETTLSFASVAPPATGGGGAPVLPIVGVAVVLLALVAAFVFIRKRKPRAPAGIPVDQRFAPIAGIASRRGEAPPLLEDREFPVTAEQIGEPLGVLVSRAGNDAGREYTIGSKPVGIGSGLECGVRIDDPDMGREEAKVWVRDGHLMLHKVTRLQALTETGRTGGWTILEPGDIVEIGQHRFEFMLLAPAAEPVDDAVPNVLREPEPEPTDEPVRLTDLMPKNEGGFIRPEPEEQAS